jgi:hypothetical protein
MMISASRPARGQSADVLANDNILPGSPATLRITEVAIA